MMVAVLRITDDNGDEDIRVFDSRKSAVDAVLEIIENRYGDDKQMMDELSQDAVESLETYSKWEDDDYATYTIGICKVEGSPVKKRNTKN